jgi:hypothetical protein
MSTSSPAAGAWTWKQFFKGECGFCRFLTGVLVLYVMFNESDLLPRIVEKFLLP